MHLGSLNIKDLLLGLYRGTIDCDKQDSKDLWDWAILRDNDIWTAHGATVAAATPYLPGCFDRPPRNPAEKLSSGYKAKEFQTYFFGLAPALFYGILPEKYWRHFCKLVNGMRTAHLRKVTRLEMVQAHRYLLEFVHEFELLFYQCKTSRIHFVRQSIHLLTHIMPETKRSGPLGLYSQWTMERTIGDLTGAMRQPSNPYRNLTARALQRCQINALEAIIPTLDLNRDADTQLPAGAWDVGNGYVLLRKRDRRTRRFSLEEKNAVAMYLSGTDLEGNSSLTAELEVRRWARLRLPNGQVARSLWKESAMRQSYKSVRQACNVKLDFGEVQYYFIMECDDKSITALAMVSMYSPPDRALWEFSHGTLWRCEYQGQQNLRVLPVSWIQAVVGMVPFPQLDENGIQHLPTNTSSFFVVEKMGLDVTYLQQNINAETLGDDDDT
ncbi:hypothetical protein FISHEDRAFT_64952 [Fistulina hepatica ATCC 64428]|uniref:Uncharacterized protein n=1 Tax=Fistulina hepatica ATCC 64428 TaxID=1128425 RepID=A0A0D7AHL4_9AGAR|nr:hypothetical protein FISHEDRAFT_64952 [Fistulina hepatica ATCC 64428]